ncbi:rod shape-determining protein MreC [Salibacterium salarium]|uniref:Cell shape-determining protein MreC n=1 Tax=Salibacterium salarium TaxID=284579 RepID=A0A3R9P7W6_9BACI|nr:rod shape-determining protein MreC [Salibacterium salarium]MDQ0298700.1 rod shape-determining protein MreC [Salibacterium salarium]RSL32274.1 rod shape-determining protein MreC [Salibacterium salarium]
MPHFFSNKRLILLMVSIIVLVALIGFSMRERESATWPEKFVRDSTGVVQSVLSRPAHFVAGFFGDIVDVTNVYEENKLLKSRMEEFASLSAELESTKQENDTLKEMIDSKESLMNYTTRSALVIHRTPDRWTETIGINKGAQDGLEKDMAVVTSEGLIGKVDTASEFTSTVQLLSDGNRTNRVSAMVNTDNEPVYAFIEGWDEEREGLMLRKIESDAEIEEGQMVMTSGLGGVFPRGLAIGEITSISPDEYGLTYNALIEPAADYYNLEQVNVIERTSETLDEDIEEQTDDEEDGEDGEDDEDPIELEEDDFESGGTS